MPERQPPSQFRFSHGLLATQNQFVPGTAIDGLNMFYRGMGRWEIAAGFGASVGTSGGVNPMLNVSNTHAGLTGGGSISQAFAANVYFFAGSGTAFVGGVSKGAAGSSITINTGAATVNAGLTSPGAATIAATGVSGHNNGSNSIVLTAIRSTTGGESTMGAPSNVVSFKNEGCKITALGAIDSNADKIGIYVSKKNLGSSGPYFHLYDVSLATVQAGIAAGGYVIQVPGDSVPGWLDGQVGDLAPLDYNLPPACTHCIVINSVVVAAGCYGGAGLAPSYPNKPEAYPAKYVVFIPGGGRITAVKGTGIEGAVLVATGSSLNLVRASNSPVGPISIEQMWPTTGFVSANQFCVVKDEIFAYVGTRGAVRSGLYSNLSNEAERFAQPVEHLFAVNGFTAANTVVAYDPKNNAVWFMSGTVGIPYMLGSGEWSTPHLLPVSAATATSDTSRMLLSDASGNLYTPENGAGVASWSLVSWFDSSAPFMSTIIGLRSLASIAHRCDIFINDQTASTATGGTNISCGQYHGACAHLNIPDALSWAVKWSGTGNPGAIIQGADVLYTTHPVRAG